MFGMGGPGGGAYGQLVVNDLIPWVDSNFRTLAEQPHRAMAGLSMGAMQTRMVTLANIDKFSHIGLFSGGSIAATNITDMAAFKEKVKLVFVGYGSREVDPNNPRRGGGGRGGDPKLSVDSLKAAGINSHYYVSPETAHEWLTWRRCLREYATLLFKN